MHSKIINNLEKLMIPVKQSMEEIGLNVNLTKLKNLIEETSKGKNEIEMNLKHSLAITEDINFNSSKDVSDLLSEKLGVSLVTTRTGRCSTARRILRGIHNPLTDEIIRYRDLERLLSSLKAIHNATDKAKGKIYCIYDDACPSGRIYTRDYSFQSIPETARGVVYADSGHTFILADYDAFELRILSGLSYDTYFKNCWAKGLDLHRKVVADMKGIPYDNVTKKERQLGKALNFGLAYGQEPAGLARNLNISTSDARVLMATYKSKIPAIERFKREAIKKARETGFTETYHGRKRFLPDINSPNIRDCKKAERRVINTAIQGTAADIVKFSIVELYNQGFMINTMVHDSILLTVPENNVEASIQQIREIMETEINGMRFTVTCRTGHTWRECSK